VETWPNFFIVGAGKAGTSSLWIYLNQVPQVFMSPHKEPHFFSPTYLAPKIVQTFRNKNDYLNLFQDVRNEKVIGEASINYLLDPTSPKLIHEKVPHAKIIIIIRDPIERAYSNYFDWFRGNIIKDSFHETIQDITSGKAKKQILPVLYASFYSKGIKNFQDTFGNNQVKIIIFEEYIKNMKLYLNDILKFLDIDYNIQVLEEEVKNPFLLPKSKIAGKIVFSKHLEKIVKKSLPESYRKKISKKFFVTKVKPIMNEQDILFLKSYFRKDVLDVEKLLNRKLPWKNFQ